MDLNFSPFPVITTDRLVLRRMTAADAPEMFFFRSDTEVMRYIARPKAKTEEEALAFINMVNGNCDRNEAITWSIDMKGNEKMIGNICLWNVQKDNYRAVLGYVLHPTHHGKGIMTEAVAAVLNYGFNTMGLHSIEAEIDPLNNASARVLERAGFVREAYFKENIFFDGEFLDSAIYSLLAPVRS